MQVKSRSVVGLRLKHWFIDHSVSNKTVIAVLVCAMSMICAHVNLLTYKIPLLVDVVILMLADRHVIVIVRHA